MPAPSAPAHTQLTHLARTAAARHPGATWSLLDMELKSSPFLPPRDMFLEQGRAAACVLVEADCMHRTTFPSTAWSPRFLESIVHTLATGSSFNPTTRGKRGTGAGSPWCTPSSISRLQCGHHTG